MRVKNHYLYVLSFQAKRNREIASLQWKLDDVPSRAELSQYQRRFIELYNQGKINMRIRFIIIRYQGANIVHVCRFMVLYLFCKQTCRKRILFVVGAEKSILAKIQKFWVYHFVLA